METKRTTHYTVRQGRIKLWCASLSVTDQSGDTVVIDYPSNVFRDALADYVVSSVGKSEQQSMIALLTNSIREREEREAKWAEEASS